jgi:hypothetical protein
VGYWCVDFPEEDVAAVVGRGAEVATGTDTHSRRLELVLVEDGASREIIGVAYHHDVTHRVDELLDATMGVDLCG